MSLKRHFEKRLCLDLVQGPVSRLIDDLWWKRIFQSFFWQGFCIIYDMKPSLITLRLALYGCTNRPFYYIVATHRKKARNRGYFEQVSLLQ